jgi:hypothetical protein
MIRKEKICLLIDVAVSDDSNFNTKETENLSMYEDLENDVSRMWEVRTKIVPVILGALERLDQKLQLLPGQPSAIELQITLMSTANIIRKVLE